MTEEALYEILEWDSNFFGFRIAKVTATHLDENTARRIDEQAKEDRIDCLYFLANYETETVRIAENFNYGLQDVRMTLSMPLPGRHITGRTPDHFKLDTANVGDLPVLLPIIENLFLDSRFYNDPHFTSEQCDELFKTWLKRSIEETDSNRVFVFRKEGVAGGFLICRLHREEKVGNMSLMGVAHDARSNDLGTSLVAAGLDYFVAEGMTSTDIVTQGRNIPSQRIFQKFGYRTSQIALWYHKWF